MRPPELNFIGASSSRKCSPRSVAKISPWNLSRESFSFTADSLSCHLAFSILYKLVPSCNQDEEMLFGEDLIILKRRFDNLLVVSKRQVTKQELQ